MGSQKTNRTKTKNVNRKTSEVLMLTLGADINTHTHNTFELILYSKHIHIYCLSWKELHSSQSTKLCRKQNKWPFEHTIRKEEKKAPARYKRQT